MMNETELIIEDFDNFWHGEYDICAILKFCNKKIEKARQDGENKKEKQILDLLEGWFTWHRFGTEWRHNWKKELIETIKELKNDD